MRFKADEIVSVLQTEIEHYRGQLDTREVGRVLEVGDGIARVYGLSGRHGRRNGRVQAGRRPRPGLQPGRELGRRHHPGRLPGNRRRRRSLQDRQLLARAGRRRPDWPRGRSAGQSDGRQGPGRHHAEPTGRIDGARRGGPAARQSAAANRHQGHRLHDADRPRPARTDHRRPQDRQDRHRRRHDHQSARRERHLRLRRHRSEGIDRRAGRRKPARPRRHGLHDRRHRVIRRPGAAAIYRSLRRLRDGRILHVRAGTGHALHLRRSDEAGRRLPAAVAA